jgi:hypothetical protein
VFGLAIKAGTGGLSGVGGQAVREFTYNLWVTTFGLTLCSPFGLHQFLAFWVIAFYKGLG